jgi:tetratricopeptide (TPR) repeat protein
MSRSRSRWIAVLLLTSACATMPRPASGEGSGEAVAQNVRTVPDTRSRHFLTPPELMTRIESSPVQYLIQDLESLKGLVPEQLVDAVWPEGPEPLEVPVVELSADGSRAVKPAKFNPEAMALIQQGEVHYQAKRYAEAEKLYAQALEKEPGNYLAALNLGDTALFSGDAKTALTRYEQAARLNPDDHRSYFFRGTALLRLDRMAEARDMYAWALTLRPEHPYVMRALEQNADTLGIRVQPRVLRPRALARVEDKGVSVHVDPKSPWFIYGLCKALWLGEESHREEMTGERDYHPTNIEELECLGLLGAVYARFQEEGKPKDPALERFMRIVEDGYGKELILYEVLGRQAPHVVLTLEPEARERLHQYVLRHVVPLAEEDDSGNISL